MISYFKRQWSDVDVFRCGIYSVQFVINISQQLSAINALMLQTNMFTGGNKKGLFLKHNVRIVLRVSTYIFRSAPFIPRNVLLCRGCLSRRPFACPLKLMSDRRGTVFAINE